MEIKKSKIKRKKYIAPARNLFLLFVFGFPLLSLLLMNIIPGDIYDGNLLGLLLGLMCAYAVPALAIHGGLWMYRSGRSKTSSISLFDNELVYSFYSGSSENRETFIFHIKTIKAYTLSKSTITIFGDLEKVISDSFGTGKKDAKKVKIPRVFENEDKMLAFLDAHRM